MRFRLICSLLEKNAPIPDEVGKGVATSNCAVMRIGGRACGGHKAAKSNPVHVSIGGLRIGFWSAHIRTL